MRSRDLPGVVRSSGTGFGNAAADAAGACQAWSRVPALDKVFSKNDSTSEVYFDRAAGAAALARSAAEPDDRYDALDKALQDVVRRLETYNLEGAEAVSAYEKAGTVCVDVAG
ncbi:hypothetical protein [Streptomyces minutiscleroticus]|uniref:hypothetical protein n=1 Tax=Streptomyces minutiscleroticus TaxID=68238 RepID=UPI00167D9049|nr:hypothetical protein [Streptomyces minutiscleroticus]